MKFDFGGLENFKRYSCSVPKMTCVEVKKSSSTEERADSLREGQKIETDTPTAGEILRAQVPKDAPNASRLTLSPDGRFLAYYLTSKTDKNKERYFKLLDLAGGSRVYSTKSKVPNWDLMTEELRLFAFSPNSKKLLYLDDRNGFSTIYEVKLDATKIAMSGRQVITRNYTISDFLFWDNDNIFFVANRESRQTWSLYKFNLTTLDLAKVSDNISYADTIKKVDGKLIFLKIVGNSQLPYAYDLATAKVLAFSGIAPEKYTAPGKKQVLTLAGQDAILVTPVGVTKPPLIVWLHGGPYRQAVSGYHSYLSYAVYDWMLDEAVRGGSAVLKLNYVGSYGYGRSFADSIVKKVGNKDVWNVINAVDELKKKNSFGPVYLVGNSYGGYLALRTLEGDVKSYRGAFSINGVTDWPALLKHYGNSIFNTFFGGLPSTANAALFKQASITDKLSRLGEHKIILAQASDDRTIPKAQAERLAEQLISKGKDVETLFYNGEDHVFKQEESMRDLCLKLFKLIDRPSAGRCQI